MLIIGSSQLTVLLTPLNLSLINLKMQNLFSDTWFPILQVMLDQELTSLNMSLSAPNFAPPFPFPLLLPFPHFQPSPTSLAGQRASRARHRHNEACRYFAAGVASGGAVVSSSCCCPPFSPLAERRAFRACYQRQGRTSHPPPHPTTTTHTSPPHLTQHFHHHTSCCHFQIQGSPRKRGSSRRGSGSAQPPNPKPCFISPTNLPDGPLAELDTCCLSPRTQELPSEPHDGTINPLRHQQQPTLLEPPWRLA